MRQSLNGNYLSSELHHLQPGPLCKPPFEEPFNTTHCKAALYCTQSHQCTTTRVPPSVTHATIAGARNKCWHGRNYCKRLRAELPKIQQQNLNENNSLNFSIYFNMHQKKSVEQNSKDMSKCWKEYINYCL